MASLKQVRQAIKDTVEASIPDLTVHRTVRAVNVLPALVPTPAEGDFATMARGLDAITFDMPILVVSNELELGQDDLDDYLTGNGPKSLRKLLRNHTLGLANTSANVSGWTNYGGRYESCGLDHIGATLRLIVHTPGTD